MRVKSQKIGVVIAHYSSSGRLAKHLLNLVQALSSQSDNIIFVSTGILEDELSSLSPYATVIARENIGYDFWSYKVGIEALGDLTEYKKVLCFNSSFICLRPELLLEKAFLPLMHSGLNGITFSTQDSPHIQSYWFSFEGELLENPSVLLGWWQQLQPISERNLVVKCYEIGMSRWFIDHGVGVSALFEPSREDLLVALTRLIATRRVRPQMSADGSMAITFDLETAKSLNPTHFLWDSLINEFGILKLDLLINNPTQQDLRRYLENLKKFDPNLLELIDDAIACH